MSRTTAQNAAFLLTPLSLAALAYLATAMFSQESISGQEQPLPNVVFILADDIGYSDLASYGGRVPTPNIDSLARDGMRFTDAHSPAALCAPSRFSLLTGSYPHRNGRPGGSWDVNNSSGFSTGADHLVEGRHITVGEILQRSGYRTGFVGKSHLGGDVYDAAGQVIREKARLNEMDFSRGVRDGISAHGFDYSFVLQSGIQHEPYAYFENGRYWPLDPYAAADNSSTTLYTDGLYEIGSNGVSEIVEAQTVPARADRAYDSSQAGPVLTYKALEFIDEHLRKNEGEGSSRPFALYFSSQAIHVPHTPPVLFGGDPASPDLAVAGTTGGATSDMIRELDLQVGALLDRLEAAGVLEDTLIFFTSDNGALWPDVAEHGDPMHDNNGPWRGYKASIYEGGHRVPFVVRWGDGSTRGSRIAPGASVDHTVVNHDWVATMYELTRQPMAEDQAVDSASLLPLLLGQSDDPVHDFILYQAGYSQYGAIREDEHVVMVDEYNVATEYYDLERDPEQSLNLVDVPEYRDRVQSLRDKFLRYNDHDNNTFDEPRTTAAYTPDLREE